MRHRCVCCLSVSRICLVCQDVFTRDCLNHLWNEMMSDGELVEVTAAETAGSEELLTNSAGAVAKRGAGRASVSFTIVSLL